ncbi:LacI family DNA-binding transcriptional regulator [Actinomadura barringtoniae]|uniref:LacI family DNA-binding transcriptional regulator n=1 Tax=Actinomadura barringtoniae TaxID=1427535 RepID=A0A939T6L8_9ACTN|nr:LacI family DNA-binding transcriptional regulator [Actinomadura barringtoniae]MBO2450984.1 LacI family DNA-binding transcriptional regulator [Actinomadura barringtoniae]
MAGVKDVARLAGVSVATVSRVLNDSAAVTEPTRARVLAAVAELGYRPNAVARSLRTDATRTIGLIIGDILNPFFTELARAVEDEARTLGYSVVIGNADERPDRQDHYVRTLLEQRVDGLLLCPTAEITPLVRDMVAGGEPLVFLDRTLPGLEVPTVRADGAEAINELVGHLRTLGHRRLAFISGPALLSTGRERTAAFVAALGEHGLAVREDYLEAGDFQAASGRASAARLLDLGEPPEVIVAGDNLMALGALDEIRARGLRIPADVGLASYDDLPWFTHLDPPLTAIAQPVQALGRRSVRALIERVAGQDVGSVVLSARLVVRRSCGEPPFKEGSGPA